MAYYGEQYLTIFPHVDSQRRKETIDTAVLSPHGCKAKRVIGDIVANIEKVVSLGF